MGKWSITAILILWLVIASVWHRDALACESISSLGFEPIAPDVFVDDSISPEHYAHVLSAIAAGTSRVAQYYGAPLSSPRYIVTNSVNHVAFGLNSTAMQRSGFSKECIFLGPKGQNTDVIAHELVHAETRYRTSLFAETLRLPTWFIEGIAVAVDHRAPLLLKNIQLPPQEVEQIKRIHFSYQWNVANPRHYQAARVAITPLQPQRLYAKLARIDSGEPFKQVFPELHEPH